MNNKKRSDNWIKEEKDLLRQLVGDSSNIIENKDNSTSINLKKAKEWKKITTRLNNKLNKGRTESQVKMAWKRMKLAAKASVSLHRRLSRQTGGGKKHPSPTPEEQAIMGIAPHDFIEKIHPFDSDAFIVELENPIKSLNDEVHSEETLDREHTIRQSTDELKQKIVESNINTKNKSLKMSEELHVYHLETAKRTLKMMEELHEHNLKIAILKAKKLELEIELLQK